MKIALNNSSTFDLFDMSSYPWELSI